MPINANPNVYIISSRILSIFLLSALAACGTATPTIETATEIPIPTETIALPTASPTYPSTIEPTPTLALEPLPTPISSEIFPLDNLRMAYPIDGNLYVQDGSQLPKKVSDSGEDWFPIFSDDGKRIVFHRGEMLDYNSSVFSINADGSDEREIITKKWLDSLDTGTRAGHLTFIPNTHDLLFNTYLCPESGFSNPFPSCTVGVFLVDSDTGKIKTLASPTSTGYLILGGDSRRGSNFSVSPDGILLSIASAGHIDIFNTNGEIVHHNIVEYLPSTPVELYPKVYWFANSEGAIVAIPAETEYYAGLSGNPAYSIWKYMFDDNSFTQIPLTPQPSWTHMEANDVISISPNREWGLYFTGDDDLYQGNLLDGSTELLFANRYYLPMLWNSSSVYYANSTLSLEAILGSINSSLSYSPDFFWGWIDEKQFIYFSAHVDTGSEYSHVLVGEINKNGILTYETHITVPQKRGVSTYIMMDE